MLSTTYRLIFLFVAGLFLLSGCNLPQSTVVTPTSGGDIIGTAAAATVQAMYTQASSGQLTPLPTTPVIQQPTATPQPTSIVVVPPTPTNTSAPLPTALPTATTAPTQIPVPCDRASFVKDITYPDGSEVPAGSTFVKTWRLKNNGTCTWNSSYALVFSGGDSMNGPAAIQLTTGTVAPGQEIDVSVTLKAPDSPKEYTGNWKLRNGNNTVFGIGANAQAAFWVKIKVVSPVTPTPTATVLYNFLDKAPSAEWRNGTALLPWGDPPNDGNGVAVYLENAKLNDGKTYTKVLATYPQRIDNGVITGLFGTYTVKTGDHFTARLGFRANCGNGKVKFQLNYIESGIAIALREWSKSCDSSLLNVDVDLSSLNGKTVSFMLAVVADGPMDDDFAVWIDPRIQR